jgi:transposase
MNFSGIDYHIGYSLVNIINEQGETLVETERVAPNTLENFQAVFSRVEGPVQVTFECGLNWGYLYELLYQLDNVVEVIPAHAAKVRVIAEAEIKNDKIDSRNLSILLRAGLIPGVYVPGKAVRERKNIIRQRVYWVKNRTRLRNRIHRILDRQVHLELPQVTDIFGKRGRVALAKALLPEPDALLLEQDLHMLDTLDQLIKEDEKLMKQAGEEDAVMEWLQSMPGIGLIMSSIIATEIDDITRFSDSSRLCSYAGLIPSTRSSGGHTWHGHMLRNCNHWLKWAFVESAWVAIQKSSYLGHLYRIHRRRGKKPNLAIIIVARRMCQIVWQMLTEHREYEERQYYYKRTPGRPVQGMTEAHARCA